MAPQTATTDDDLLIISDDSADADISLEEASIDISDAEETTTNEETISFDTDTEVSAQPSETKEEVETPIQEESLATSEPVVDLSLDTPDEKVEKTEATEVSQLEEVKQEVANSEEVSDFSLDLGEGEVSETASEEIKTETLTEEAPTVVESFASSDVAVETGMNTILAETVAKLESRQTVIASEKDAKSGQVTDLKAQIKKLEEEVALHEWEIEELDSESKKIATNVKALEKMKLDEEVTKEHNSKRVPKK